MIEWLAPLVPLLKALHIAALSLWCGGLLVLPVMLASHEHTDSAVGYRRVRYAVHLSYTLVVTPAGVVTIIAGTWLILLREVYAPWLFLKLGCVALLVAVHAWIGRLLVRVAELPGRHRPPPPWLPCGIVLLPVLAILLLVLSKPQLAWLTPPEWLQQPRQAQLPFEIPKR